MPHVIGVLLGLFLGLSTLTATAAQWKPSHCVALSQGLENVHYASLAETNLTPDRIRLKFLGHSTYILETAAGVRIATDYTGALGDGKLPTIVTMNHAHSSHYTDHPDPRIPHVLRGWGDADGPADHYLELEDVIVRNVTTDIRSYGGQEPDGNSIFIFEVAGLCVGHLGHLHHEPSLRQYALIGRLDAVMAPVDGGMTLDVETMIKVLKTSKSRVVLPMHWFGSGTLSRFIEGMRGEFAIDLRDSNTIELSLADLPDTPTVVVLQPRYSHNYDD